MERRSAGTRLSAAELAAAVAEYGRRLVPLPPGRQPLDVVQIASAPATAPAWSVDVPLWTAEEGRSDLTLSLTVVGTAGGAHRIEVDNLHVL